MMTSSACFQKWNFDWWIEVDSKRFCCVDKNGMLANGKNLQTWFKWRRNKYWQTYSKNQSDCNSMRVWATYSLGEYVSWKNPLSIEWQRVRNSFVSPGVFIPGVEGKMALIFDNLVFYCRKYFWKYLARIHAKSHTNLI